MDVVIGAIVRHALSLEYGALPAAVPVLATRRIVDAMGCAIAAADTLPVRAAEAVAPASPGGPGRRLGHTAGGTSLDAAAFVNTTMIRCLDFNDWAPYGHPSDSLGPLLALADEPGVSGRRLLTAMAVAYDVFIVLTEATRLPQRGWDQGFCMGLAMTAAIGSLLDLPEDQLASALSIVAVSGVPTRATRSAELSVWKGCATAFAARNAMFAVLLAREGVTGPPEPFEGKGGIWDLVTGPFEPSFPGPGHGEHRILGTALKYWPMCFHAQAVAWAAAELRDTCDIDLIDDVEIATYEEAWRGTGSEPTRWAPQSRETADHSSPYAFARMLLTGTIDLDAFDEAAYRDESALRLMSRVRVVSDDAMTKAFPAEAAARITVRMTDGAVVRAEVRQPRGTAANPLSETELREKFLRLAERRLGGAARASSVFQAWTDIGEADALRHAMDLSLLQPA